jgi:hypothetical protein
MTGDPILEVPGQMNEFGSFVPNVADVYAQQYAGDPEARTLSAMRRQRAVGNSLSEMLQNEALLQQHGIEPDPPGRIREPEEDSMAWYWRYPLWALTQLQRGQYAMVGGIEGLAFDRDPSVAVRNFYRGLIHAEPHETSDLMARADFSTDSAWKDFIIGLGGDIAADPLSWFTFGASGVAKAILTAGGKTKPLMEVTEGVIKKIGTTGSFQLTKADEIRPYLSKFGNDVLDKSMQSTPEEAVVFNILQEIQKGTPVGKKLLPSNVEFAHWLPWFGGRNVGDIGYKFRKRQQLIPGGVVQHIDDLEATEGIMSKLTEAMMGSPVGKLIEPFGQAFVPYWELRKYPEVREIIRAHKSGNYEEVREAMLKGQKLVEMLPDPEQRELLTELLNQPSLFTGKQFVKKLRRRKDTVEVEFNTDYFGKAEITENQAGEIVDLFYEVARAARRQGADIVRETMAGAGIEGTVVAGQEVLEQFRPIFQAVVEATSGVSDVALNFGDWAIKMPVGQTLAMEPMDFYNAAVNYAKEAYVLNKLGDSAHAAQGHVVFRRYGDLYPEQVQAQARRIGGTTPYFTNRAGDAPVTLGDLPAGLKWTQIEGGWQHYLKANPDPKTREIKNIHQFIKAISEGPVKLEDMMVPLVVKKFIRGETLAAKLETMRSTLLRGLRPSSAAYSQIANNIADNVAAVSDTLHQIAKTGIAPTDFHVSNVMVGDAGQLVWIDYGHWDDYTRGVTSFSGAGVEPELLGTLSGPIPARPEDILKTKRRAGEKKAREAFTRREGTEARLERTEIMPGIPGFEAKHPKLKYPKTEKKLPDAMAATAARMKSGYSKALKHAMENASHTSGALKRSITDPVDAIMNSRWPEQTKMAAILRMLQTLKDRKIIREYAMGDSPLRFIGYDEAKAAVMDFDEVYMRGPVKFKVAWANDGSTAYEPIVQRVKKQVNRDWVENIEVITAKHPKLAGMSAADQLKLLRAYKFSSEWLTDLNQALSQRQLIDIVKLNDIKRELGITVLPKINKATNLQSLRHLMERSIKGQVKIEGLSTQKAHDTIAEINKVLGYKLYEDDIAKLLTRHAIDVSLATNSFDLIEHAARVWGRPANAEITKVVQRVGKTRGETKDVVTYHADPGWELLDHPATQGLQMPTEITKAFKAYTRSFVSDHVMAKVFRGYDRLLAQWKGYATYTNPGFHGRNFISNLFNLYLKDGPQAINPVRHAIAVQVMSGLPGKLKVANGKYLNFDDVRDQLRRHGVMGTGWVHADIHRPPDIQLGIGAQSGAARAGQMMNPASLDFGPMQVGRKVGGAVENEARVLGAINDLIKTNGNYAYAAQNTKKFLFDYTELTNFEREVSKRIFPFYTWLRKNVELQVTQVLKNPGRYVNVPKVRSNLEAVSPETDERWVPKYFPELYAMRIPEHTKKGSPLYINPNLPFQDLNRIFSMQDWISSVAPWRIFFDLHFNKKAFSGAEIEKYKGELEPMEALNVLPDNITKYVAKTLTKLGIETRQIYEPETEQWLWAMPAKAKYVLEQLNPFFRNVNRMSGYMSGEENIPYYRREQTPYQMTSWMTGVKLMPYNIPAEFERSTFERREHVRGKLDHYRKLGIVPSEKYNLPPDKLRKLPKGH